MNTLPRNELQTFDRLHRRMLHLESEIGLVLAEMEYLRLRLERVSAFPELGRELDFGLERLFAPGELSFSQAPKPYHKYCMDLFWIGYDSQKRPAPAIAVWHGNLRGDRQSPGRNLCVHLGDSNGHTWLLLEIFLDWATLNATTQLSVGVRAVADPPVSVPVSLYAVDKSGKPLITHYPLLALDGNGDASTTTLHVTEAFYTEADQDKPPKLQLNLINAGGAQIDIMDMRLFAADNSK
jgi:hypothetical protein